MPPSEVTIWPIVLVAGRIFMPLMSVGTRIFLRAWKVPGSCTKAKQTFTSFISVAAYWRYHASMAAVPPLPLAKRKGSEAPAMIGKRPGW